jgi:hypothetical protein
VSSLIGAFVAYAVAAPGLAWLLRDVDAIPRRVWWWSGLSRSHWRTVAMAAYACLGLPVFAAALAWRFGRDRAALLDELEWRRTNADEAAAS